MERFVEGQERSQTVLFPDRLDDRIAEDHPVRVIDVFVEELDPVALGFGRSIPAASGRPGYRPTTLLKIYIYGYLNRIQSSRRLEREARRNLELIWLTGRLAPVFKTIADFRRDNGASIRKVCARFISTTGDYRRITRWEHEEVLDLMQRRLERTPNASRWRRQTVEHTFGTIKALMGSTHFLMKTLPRVRTEMSLHVLACNIKRAMNIRGVLPLMQAMTA